MHEKIIRLTDIVVSFFTLVVLSPLFIIVICILFCTGEHKVFFRQKRVGKDGIEFFVYKFATMLHGSASMPGGNVTAKNDPRVLPVGRLLRFTKINELPQLLNVLYGEMSLIGPRPVPRDIYDHYPMNLRKQVFASKPGLSGMGSLIFRDEASILKDEQDPNEFHREVISPYKLECDLWYTNQKSFFCYALMICGTLYSVALNPNPLKLIEYFNLPNVPEKLKKKLKTVGKNAI